MGELANVMTATAATNTLNWMFTDNIATTYQRVQAIRAAGLTKFLNPDFQNMTAVDKRRSSLRFAALILMDESIFDETYPSAKFRQWLKWLTWLGKQRKEDFTSYVNGAAVTTKKPSRIILEVLQAALPVSGTPRAVYFTWHPAPSNFTLSVNMTTNPIQIDLVTKDDQGLTDADSEDDV